MRYVIYKKRVKVKMVNENARVNVVMRGKGSAIELNVWER